MNKTPNKDKLIEKLMEGSESFAKDGDFTSPDQGELNESLYDTPYGKKSGRELITALNNAAIYPKIKVQRDAAVAALRDELDALEVWIPDKLLPLDVRYGLEISRDKITRAIAAAEKA